MATGTQSQHQNERFVTEAVFPQIRDVQPEDLTSAGQTYLYCPVAGVVSAVYSVVNVLTAGVSTLTVKDNAGDSMGTVTIADASAVGTIDSLSPSSNNSVSAGDVIEIENDATPTAGAITVTVVISEA